MARTDRSPEVADRDALRAEEGPLAAFFDAVRAEAGTPPPAFLAALLADSTALAPGPGPVPAPRPAPEPVPAPEPLSAPIFGPTSMPAPVRAMPAPGLLPAPRPARRRPGLRARIGARLAPLGGWAGAGALAASLAIGFWAGVSGLGADYATPTLWPDVATMDSATAGIGDFYDLSSLEG